ncbi:MAG: 2-C-methyl-D-erythritol 4-phosphate cytidylyltransferase [Roseburia sp.]|nr:2-C-methyl-D-erythritol 4-phosphate cytidylyltransferase [Roseburia sp.]MCM1099625.1 2-C-methyl-D-erythritol 4-phosphate cytidylyltransferase [Ruminococcus flavefaciens]
MERKPERQRPRCSVILLAGGSGKRMGTEQPKQYLEIAGRPMIWYSLRALERSAVVDDCILVVPEGDIDYAKEKIVQAGQFSKALAVVAGGRERYESVWRGIRALTEREPEEASRIVMIHDGARPCLTEEILERCFYGALEYGACTAAVPSKDTITLSDGEGFEADTPDRKYVWNVQTPQAFRREILLSAFERMAAELETDSREKLSWITDDVSVVRRYGGARIRLVQGDYRNIKVTTIEDLRIAESFLKGGF